MTTEIAVLAIGHKPNAIIDNILGLEDAQINLILNNLLDYSLPPKVENSVPQRYLQELRFILMQLGAGKYVQISDSLSSLLKENDRLGLSDEDLEITAHIGQIELNSKNLAATYKILIEETGKTNVKIIPLAETTPDLHAFKGKKNAPLRFYAEQGELLNEDPPAKDKKRKYPDKKLIIENLELLDSVKITEEVEKTMDDSDIVLITASDLISLGTLIQCKEMRNQIKKTSTPIVFIWTLSEEVSEAETEIAETMEFGLGLEEFSNDLAELTDYVIIDRSRMEIVEALRNEGCKVLVEDIWTKKGKVTAASIKTILSVGGIANDGHSESTSDDEGDLEALANSDKPVVKQKAKPLSQLVESPEESGQTLTKEESTEEAIVKNDENGISTIEDTLKELAEVMDSEIEGFEILDEEEWFDTASRAIEGAFEDIASPAFEWIKVQSTRDSEKEQQIAESLINRWIESRSITSRRQGALLILEMVTSHRVIYQQILQLLMITSVNEKADEKRRQLVLLYQILYEEADVFTQTLIGGIVRELASLDDENNQIVFEIAKTTILQLVINRRKLTTHAVGEILRVLDNKQGSNAELWNILTSFDARVVAIELVTLFSINKLDEITRKSSILRFTGSYYSIISKVISAWKDGDQVALSNVIGSILPESTLRKFERMELARSVGKLRMVQLSTLAETIKKDVKEVEKLVTELIVNGELAAEFKLIDEKMYLVASEEEV